MENESKKYLKLNDIESYKVAFYLSNRVWDIVIKWNAFEQRTVGEQFVRAIDSISANIAEGFGRYTKKDKIKFFRYSQGSFSENLDWNEKAKVRKLISIDEYKFCFWRIAEDTQSIKFINSFYKSKIEDLKNQQLYNIAI